MAGVVQTSDRELSVTEMIAESLSIYSSHFAELSIPFAVTSLLTGISSVTLFRSIPEYALNLPADVRFEWLFSELAEVILATLILGLVAWVTTTIVSGIAVKYTSDVLKSGEGNYLSALNGAFTRLPSLLAAGLITAFLVMVGLVAFIIPGLILAAIFSLFIPVILIEGTGAIASLGRSRRLVSKGLGKTVALLLIVGGIVFSVTLISDSVIGLVVISPIRVILVNLIVSLFQPIYVVAITLLYYSLAAKELSML